MRRKGSVWMNGALVPLEKATVPLLSHGFSRGSAIFEVLGTHKGPDGVYAFRMDEHVSRLEQSAQALDMEIAYTSDEIARAVMETVQANDLERGIVKIFAYWGEEAVIKLVLDSKLDVAIFAIPDSEELGLDNIDPVSACLSKWRKIDPKTVPVSAKACANYLNGYLARKDAADRGFDVGLLIGTDDFLAEGSIESVFLVKDGILKTPSLGRILSGITRKSILRAAEFIDLPTSEEPIKARELFTADEIFTAGTGSMISPVDRFEDRNLQAPGPVSKQLIDLIENIFNFTDDRFSDWFQRLY